MDTLRCVVLGLVLASCGKAEAPTAEQEQARMELEAKTLAAVYGHDGPNTPMTVITEEPDGGIHVGSGGPALAQAIDDLDARRDKLLHGPVARRDVRCDAPHSQLALAVGDPIARSCRAAWDHHVIAVTTTMQIELADGVATDPDLGRHGAVTAMRATASGCELRFQLLEPTYHAGLDFELVEDHGRVTGTMWYWDPGAPRSCGHGYHVAGARE